MKILVVGAGSVGQVYGYHLSLGGAEITFYVKDKAGAIRPATKMVMSDFCIIFPY